MIRVIMVIASGASTQTLIEDFIEQDIQLDKVDVSITKPLILTVEARCVTLPALKTLLATLDHTLDEVLSQW